MKQFFCVSLMFLSTSYFVRAQNFTEKKIGHIFYASVPDYMQETRGLNDAATFQFQSEIKQAYTMIIDDSKAGLLSVGIGFASPELYYRSIEGFYLNEGDAPASSVQRLTINGKQAVQAQLTRRFDSVDLAYLITIVETDGYFYQIVSWTTTENSSSLLNDFKKIASSLHE